MAHPAYGKAFLPIAEYCYPKDANIVKANRANGFLVSLERILDDLFRSYHSTHVKLIQVKCAVTKVLVLCCQPHAGAWPKSIIIIDSTSSHYLDKIQQICQYAGVVLVFLSLNWPDFNPIEEYFGILIIRVSIMAQVTIYYRFNIRVVTIYIFFNSINIHLKDYIY